MGGPESASQTLAPMPAPETLISTFTPASTRDTKGFASGVLVDLGGYVTSEGMDPDLDHDPDPAPAPDRGREYPTAPRPRSGVGIVLPYPPRVIVLGHGGAGGGRGDCGDDSVATEDSDFCELWDSMAGADSVTVAAAATRNDEEIAREEGGDYDDEAFRSKVRTVARPAATSYVILNTIDNSLESATVAEDRDDNSTEEEEEKTSAHHTVPYAREEKTGAAVDPAATVAAAEGKKAKGGEGARSRRPRRIGGRPGGRRRYRRSRT